MMGTDPFFMYPDRRSLSDPQFVIHSFADPDPRLRTRSGSDRRSMIAILPITVYTYCNSYCKLLSEKDMCLYDTYRCCTSVCIVYIVYYIIYSVSNMTRLFSLLFMWSHLKD